MFSRQTISGVFSLNNTSPASARQKSFSKVMSVTPSRFTFALQQTIVKIMSLEYSAVVITSFAFVSRDMEIEAKYFVRVSGENSSFLVSFLLRSVKSGNCTTYFISFSGIKSANCSILPSIFVIDTSPTMRPSAVPTLSISQPSSQPTSLPTLIPSQLNSRQVISFTAVTTLFGLTNLIFASKTAE